MQNVIKVSNFPLYNNGVIINTFLENISYN